MKFYEIILLGFALSMDALAVSITNGLSTNKMRTKDALKIGLFFGVAQGVMPILGYFLGKSFSTLVEKYDHWIAFLLLGFIGVKMLYDTFYSEEESAISLDFKSLTVQAVATSIDALVVGVSFAALGDVGGVFWAATLIAAITFLLCVLGSLLGKLIGAKIGKYATVVGGIILIGIGVKILIEHLLEK